MAYVMGLLTFLVACHLVVVVAVLFRFWHIREEITDQVAGHLAGMDAAVAARAAEDRKHRDATSAIIVNAIRQVGSGVVKELRRQAHQRQAMVQELVGGTPRGLASREEWPTTSVGAPECDEPPVSTERRAAVMPGASTLPSDAPTPLSGYPVGAWLAEAEGETQ